MKRLITGAAATWGATDPGGAYRWVANLPAGTSRDRAIMSLAGDSRDFSDSQIALINSISNKEMRSQARVYHVVRIARFDRQRALSMIENLEFDAAERAQVEQFLNRASIGVVYH
jgi:hypothetical protein